MKKPLGKTERHGGASLPQKVPGTLLVILLVVSFAAAGDEVEGCVESLGGANYANVVQFPVNRINRVSPASQLMSLGNGNAVSLASVRESFLPALFVAVKEYAGPLQPISDLQNQSIFNILSQAQSPDADQEYLGAFNLREPVDELIVFNGKKAPVISDIVRKGAEELMLRFEGKEVVQQHALRARDLMGMDKESIQVRIVGRDNIKDFYQVVQDHEVLLREELLIQGGFLKNYKDEEAKLLPWIWSLVKNQYPLIRPRQIEIDSALFEPIAYPQFLSVAESYLNKDNLPLEAGVVYVTSFLRTAEAEASAAEASERRTTYSNSYVFQILTRDQQTGEDVLQVISFGG